jgi:sirohydrochlorin cobaltochelatase
VPDDQFPDATLLVLAHGSTVNSDSAVAARHQAAVLRGRGIFAAVQECFWKQAPELEETLRGARTPRVFVAPLFIGPGYFAEEVIPVALGLKTPEAAGFSRAQRRAGQTLYYAQPVGLHPRMTEVLLARAREVVARHPFPRAPRPDETTLVVVGHGTERTASSRLAVEAQVERLRARGGYAEVRPAFMEDEPRVADCLGVARSRHVVVVPFFISDGLHVAEDIPVLLGESPDRVQARVRAGQSAWRNPTERQGRLVWYAPGIGREPLLAEVILDRVREAAAWPVPD